MQHPRPEFGILLDLGLLIFPSFVCDCNIRYSHPTLVRNAPYFQTLADKVAQILISQRNFP